MTFVPRAASPATAVTSTNAPAASSRVRRLVVVSIVRVSIVVSFSVGGSLPRYDHSYG